MVARHIALGCQRGQLNSCLLGRTLLPQNFGGESAAAVFVARAIARDQECRFMPALYQALGLAELE